MTEQLHGTGLYLRRLSTRIHGTPEQAAKKAADHNLSFVALMGVWQEYRKGEFDQSNLNLRASRLKRYSEAFQEAGVDVWLWGYPWGGHEEAFVEGMLEADQQALSSGWLLDPELGYKWGHRSDKARTNMRKQPEAIRGVNPNGTRDEREEQATRLMNLSEEAAKNLGVTSYGLAKWHPNFPWKQFLSHDSAPILSPQLYSISPAYVRKGIRDWHELASDFDRERTMCASIPTYGVNSNSKLDEHLAAFDDSVDGFIGWSWLQTNRKEWDILKKYAEKLKGEE
jgi:hypothetical protein